VIRVFLPQTRACLKKPLTKGDVSLSAEDKPPPIPSLWGTVADVDEDDFEEEEIEEHHDWLQGHTAIKFLMAGGTAGAGAQIHSSLILA